MLGFIGVLALVLGAIGLDHLFRTRSGIKRRDSRNEILGKIDTVGVAPGGGILAWAYAIAKSITSTPTNVRDGYERFSKCNKPFALPDMGIGGALVVLPPSMLHLLNKPRDELSSYGALVESAQCRYMVADQDVWRNPIHSDIVRRFLTQKDMGLLAGIMAQEWDGAFRSCWKDSKSSEDLNAWDSMVRITARAALRVLVGLPGCRDEYYLDLSMLYSAASLADSCLISCLPPAVRPVAGHILALRVKYYEWKLLKVVIPMIEDQIRMYEETNGQHKNLGYMVKLLIQTAKKHGPQEMTAKRIARRVLALTALFVYTPGWVFAHTVLDIYGSPDRHEIVKTLETECRKVTSEFQGLSTREATEALYSMDSCVRESMRLNDGMAHLLPLNNISGEPIDLGEGRRLHAGSNVRTVFPVQMVHRDAALYQNPEQFDAFRFSRKVNDPQQDPGQRTNKRELITTPSTSFLSFGYGRHACPGRWFVAQIVKQALAHAVLNYDIEITKPPGKKTSLLNFMLPPITAEIHVTRKSQIIETSNV